MADLINWDSFRLRIFVEKDISTVYAALTVKEQMQTWFLEKATFCSPDGQEKQADQPAAEGDSYEWKWNNWDNLQEGIVIAANGADKVAFTFSAGGSVELELKNRNGQTEVILTQYDIPTDEKSRKEIYVGCATGWTFWLTNLKAWLEHGVTLHSKGLKPEETAELITT